MLVPPDLMHTVGDAFVLPFIQLLGTCVMHLLCLATRRLCTAYVHPQGLSAFLACRLIALDKCPGVRPIRVCETARQIISKAILYAIKLR